MQNQENVYGLDISLNQATEIDKLSPAANGLAFIICKATDGVGYIDPDFANNWSKAAQNGFIRGAYHFYRCADDPTVQAKKFVKAVGSLSAGDLPPAIDIEEAGLAKCPEDYDKVRTSVLIWLTTVETATGRKPLIYTDVSTATTYLNDSEFASYPLYIADYGVSEPTIADTVWANTGWVFWQKSGSYLIGKTENDYDAFNGDMDALRSFIANH